MLHVVHSYATARPLDYAAAAALTGDQRTALVAEPLRIILAAQPELVALEQVPAVLPIWDAYAGILAARGYSTALAVLHAEQYGVPQTRKRAVLVARRDGTPARLPAPTHSRYHPHNPGRRDPGVLPWLSMADALGWGMTARPSMTVTGGGTDTGGAESFGNGARKIMRREMDAERWIMRARRDSPRWTDAHGPRNNRTAAQPSVTVTGEAHRWTWQPAEPGQRRGSQVARDPGALRVTAAEAAALQTFPPGYPFQGRPGKQFLQIGNAVPPKFAHAILATFGEAT